MMLEREALPERPKLLEYDMIQHYLISNLTHTVRLQFGVLVCYDKRLVRSYFGCLDLFHQVSHLIIADDLHAAKSSFDCTDQVFQRRLATQYCHYYASFDQL